MKPFEILSAGCVRLTRLHVWAGTPPLTENGECSDAACLRHDVCAQPIASALIEVKETRNTALLQIRALCVGAATGKIKRWRCLNGAGAPPPLNSTVADRQLRSVGPRGRSAAGLPL